MIRIATILFLGIGLAGCVTTREEAPAALPVAATPAAAIAAHLAQELDYRARHDPAALDSVDAEMRALALRMAAPPEPDPEPEPLAPDPDGGVSLMHAVHLASYREEAHAAAGWRTLQELFPDLLGVRQARLQETDLGSRGVFLRLKAGPFDSAADAADACHAIEESGGWCAVTDFTGQSLRR
ncbi:hypothetical protein [Hyphobacterium sp.]|uniref:hypothetical protein n=1 Tax=Hyphobacterium sp. TaxID=2004662 RepID=UPI003B51BF46